MFKSREILFGALAASLFGIKLVSIVVVGQATTRILPNLWVLFLLLALVQAGRHMRADSSDRPQRRKTLALLFISGLMTTGFIALVTWVDHQLAQRKNVGVFDDPHKVWAARGLVLGGPKIVRHGDQNSIPAIRLAFDRGAKGVEVDVFFEPTLSKYVVSHDRPYNLKDGTLLTLGPLLDALGERGHFWLDFKKLRHLDQDQLRAAIAELENLTARGNLKSRFYVEGEDPLNLHAFQQAGFHTIYDTHPLPDSNPLTPLVSDLYKLIFYFGNHTVMGMNSGEGDRLIYGSETQRALRHVPMFIYHAPDDEQRLGELLDSSDVRVILVVDHSLDRYGLRGSSQQ